MATVGIIGGGVSGLAAAYYLQKCSPHVGKIILLEGKKQTGGWLHSKKHEDGSIFELGPRSLRPVGKSGKNSLRLAEELGLTKEILAVYRSDVAAKNRYLYVGGKLCALPNSFGGILKTLPPFSKPLLFNFIGEPFAERNASPDESIHNFIGRRLGKQFADIAVDAMCRGIFANDCRQLSMRSCFPDIFNLERQHGSLIVGMLRSRGQKAVEETALEVQAKEERWASWSLRGGLQQLSDTLEAAVEANPTCQVRKDSPALALTPTRQGTIKIKTADEEITANHVISAIYSKDLASLLPGEFRELGEALGGIPAVSVFVVNLEYLGHHLPVQGFGHLLPSSESPHILGIVYDSCTFSQHNRRVGPSTRLTVMLGGGWLKRMLTEDGELPDEATVANMAKEAAAKQLNFPFGIEPSKVNVSFQKECIPGYTVGHSEKMSHLQEYISSNNLPLSLIGSSYKGVSVNDCINNARIEAENIAERL